jgi:hypothetical protein
LADWLIEPRDPTLHRSLSPLTLWDQLIVSDRYLKVGSWAISGRVEQLRRLMAPGMGVVLSRDGVQVMSGQVRPGWKISGDGTATISGYDDKVWLGGGPDDAKGRIIYPDYTKPITAQELASVTFTGVREDLILALIDQHAGPSAQAARRVTGLALPASLHRGLSTKVTIQLDLLHQVVATLAEQAGLNVRVVHDESTGTPRLLVVITPVEDVSARVRFGPAGGGGPGVLGSDWSLEVVAPTMTDAIVGGTKPLPATFGNEDDQAAGDSDPTVDLRRYRVVSDASPAAAAWGFRAEGFVDSSATNDDDELDQAGLDALAEAGERREFSGTLPDSESIKYGRDWFIGYKVGVTVEGAEFADVVREVVTTVQARSGEQTEKVEAAVGWQRAAVRGTPAALPAERATRGLYREEYRRKVTL